VDTEASLTLSPVICCNCAIRFRIDRLIRCETPEESGNFLDDLNPQSLEVIEHAKLEPSVRDAAPMTRYQFERLGYFCVDRESQPGMPVFNRTVTLKDSWKPNS